MNSDEVIAATKSEWSIALVGFTPEHIGLAIEKCIKKYEMPPTLPQFVNLCQAESREPLHRSHQLYKPLPSLSIEPEVAHERLQNIMANLKLKSNAQVSKHG